MLPKNDYLHFQLFSWLLLLTNNFASRAKYYSVSIPDGDNRNVNKALSFGENIARNVSNLLSSGSRLQRLNRGSSGNSHYKHQKQRNGVAKISDRSIVSRYLPKAHFFLALTELKHSSTGFLHVDEKMKEDETPAK